MELHKAPYMKPWKELRSVPYKGLQKELGKELSKEWQQ